MTDITFGSSLTTIGYSAFCGCSGLTEIAVPDTVTEIEGNAFSGCKSLRAAYIPASVTTIGSIPFYACDPSLVIWCGAAEKQDGWSTGWNRYYAHTGDDCLTYYGVSRAEYTFWTTADKSAARIVIPDYVTMIPSSAFQNCTGLTDITLSDHVTEIGDFVFSGCSALTQITVPDSVVSIGDGAFCYCTGLKEVTFGRGVASVGFGAFYADRALARVNIGAMVVYTDDVPDTEYTESIVAWPAANMPIGLFPYLDEAWSLTMDCTLDADTTTVTLTRVRDGKVWNFSTDPDHCDGYFSVDNSGAGLPGCVIFIPDNVGSIIAGDEFQVVVSTQYMTVKYTVSFFSLGGSESAQTTQTAEPTPTVTPTPAAGDAAIGDLNGDGNINVVDALKLFRAVNGQIDAVSPDLGDLNGDGKVNVVDALKLFRFVNGQLDSL